MALAHYDLPPAYGAISNRSMSTCVPELLGSSAGSWDKTVRPWEIEAR